MAYTVPTDLVYRVVTADSSDLQIGQVVYFNPDMVGSPIGLLLSLTKNPRLTKMIKTSGGLQQVNV